MSMPAMGGMRGGMGKPGMGGMGAHASMGGVGGLPCGMPVVLTAHTGKNMQCVVEEGGRARCANANRGEWEKIVLKMVRHPGPSAGARVRVCSLGVLKAGGREA